MIKKRWRKITKRTDLILGLLAYSLTTASLAEDSSYFSSTVSTASAIYSKCLQKIKNRMLLAQVSQSGFTKPPNIDTLFAEYYSVKTANPSQAFVLIQKIVALYPNNAEAHAEYGYLLYNKNQFNDALQQLQIAEQIAPQNYFVKMQLAYTYMKLNQPQKAYDKFKEIAASATDPKIVKEAKEGMLSSQPNLAQNPNQTTSSTAAPDADSLLTEYYNLKSTQPAQAFTLIQKIVTLYPQNKDARAEYAYVLYDKKQYKEALSQFQAAEKLDPKNDDIKLQIAYCLNYLGQKQKAYKKFKQLTASSNSKVAQEAKNGMQSTSPAAAEPAKQGADALLDQYYQLKKTHPAQALILIQEIAEKYPTNVDVRQEYADSLSNQKRYKEALQQLYIAAQLKPNDYNIQLSIAYALNSLNLNRAAYFKFDDIANSATDPKIVKDAREGMISVAGYQTRFLPQHLFADLYLSPYYMTRFHDTVYYGQARAGVQFGSYNQLQLYATTYLNKDTASAGGIAPAIYSDNSIIYDLGARYVPYQDSPFYLYLEGGKAHNLILGSYTNRWTNDFRGGIDLYQDWGVQSEYAGCIKFPFKQVGNVYGDVSYYSRYDRDWIGQLRVREGLRALEYHYSVLNVFLQLEGFSDSQREFFNNVVDAGPVITFIPDVRWGVALHAIALRNMYIHVNSPSPNPYGKYYNNFLFEIETYFGF